MKVRITTQFSSSQVAIIEQMVSDLLGNETQFTLAQAVRDIIAAYAAQNGYAWPADIGQWGGLRKGAFGNEEHK